MNKIKKSTVKEINALHSELEAIVKTGIDTAIRIGELLTDCKGQLNHGEFSGWVAANCNFSQRTAQNYMKLFSHREQLAGSGSINDAYKLLRREKNESVSYLDKLRAHLQATIDEDLTAMDALKVDDFAQSLPDPNSMNVEQLAQYVQDLEEAQQIAMECLLRSRRKVGELLAAE